MGAESVEISSMNAAAPSDSTRRHDPSRASEQLAQFIPSVLGDEAWLPPPPPMDERRAKSKWGGLHGLLKKIKLGVNGGLTFDLFLLRISTCFN
jgi:hypothetical protein